MTPVEKRLAKLEALVAALADALLQHARTDVAPDSALPAMKKLAARAKAVRGSR